MTDKLVEWYQAAVTKLQSDDGAWYTSPWFVGLAIFSGVCLAVYLGYLRKQIAVLKSEKKLLQHKRRKAARDAKLAAHAEKRKELKRKATKADERRRRVDKKLRRMRESRSKIDKSIDEIASAEEARRVQNQIEEQGSES